MKRKHWSLGLLETMKDPDSIVLEDDLVIVIKDRYPKAKYHYLVCPRADIPSLKYVNNKHLPLLKHMEIIADEIASKHSENIFLIGYHAIPSMMRLHLHVISDDLNSQFLKTKKHWNSFTTDFFRPSALIIDMLQKQNSIHLSEAEFKRCLNTALKCHKCDFIPKNMPELKKHIQSHL